MKVIDPGHLYELKEIGKNPCIQHLLFIKRSGGAIKYNEEWPGLQTQEVLRVLIDRTIYLNDITPCFETMDAVQHLRMALFMYEVRAYRRKKEEVNRKAERHDYSARPHGWRDLPFGDIPFNEHEIEKRLVGLDGHIIV
ncbi:MAG: hypothetical protein AAB628_01880 [Patescibacteria group bacterium]